MEVLQEDLAWAGIVLPEPERGTAAGNAQGVDAEKAEDAEMREMGADAGVGAEPEKAEKSEPGPGPEKPAVHEKHIYKYL